MSRGEYLAKILAKTYWYFLDFLVQMSQEIKYMGLFENEPGHQIFGY
jgi:hypothetical protein